MNDEFMIFIIVFAFVLLIAIAIFSESREKLRATSFFALGAIAGFLVPLLAVGGMVQACRYDRDGFDGDRAEAADWAGQLYEWSNKKMPNTMHELKTTVYPNSTPTSVDGDAIDISELDSHKDMMSGENHMPYNPMKQSRSVVYLGDVDVDSEEQHRKSAFEDWSNSQEVKEQKIRNENSKINSTRNPHLMNQMNNELDKAEKSIWWAQNDS